MICTHYYNTSGIDYWVQAGSPPDQWPDGRQRSSGGPASRPVRQENRTVSPTP